MAKREKRTLILRFSAMGDVAMVAPVLEKAALNNPEARFVVVTSPRYDAFFSHIPHVETVCIDTKKGEKNIFGIFRFALFLCRKYRFTKVIDLHTVIRSRLLTFFLALSGKRIYCLNKMRSQKKQLLKKKTSGIRIPKTTLRYAETFINAGYKIDDLEEKSTKKVRDIGSLPEPFADFKGSNDRLIGFAPFAGYKGKVCPDRLAEEIIRKIAAMENTTLFLFGGSEEERQKGEAWAKDFKNVISAVRRLSLSEEIALISNLEVIISMDSSAQHIASITGTRAVTIWGATQPEMGFLGYGQNPKDAITLSEKCSPCSIYGNIPCYKGTYECLLGISADQVLEKL